MITFKILEKASPKFEHLNENVSTFFWEELYQLFKVRMIEEAKEEKQQ